MPGTEKVQTVFPRWAIILIPVLLAGGFVALLAGKLPLGNDRIANRPFVFSWIGLHAAAVGLFLILLFRQPKTRSPKRPVPPMSK
jgi:hypothetical protein